MKKRERILKWIEALEGEWYNQGMYYLHRDDRFCCLGVLCDLDDHGKWQGDKMSARSWNGNFAHLRTETCHYFGISTTEMADLACMNDEGKSFPEIAAYIRENILPRYQEEIPA